MRKFALAALLLLATVTASIATTVDVTVSLDQPAPYAITVDYAVVGVTASAEIDFVSQSGTLTFDAGEVAKTITVEVIADSVIENIETFNVELSAPTNARLGEAIGEWAITDDDVATISVDSGIVDEGTN